MSKHSQLGYEPQLSSWTLTVTGRDEYPEDFRSGVPLPHVRVINHAVEYPDVSFAMTQTSSITKCHPTFCDLHNEATEEDMNC